MTDDERTDRINELLETATSEMVSRGLVTNTPAAWRALLVTGFHMLPDHVGPDVLKHDLQCFANWLEHDLERL